MLKSAVLKHYKTVPAVAAAIGVTPAAVYAWGKVVPMTSAYRLELLTGGALKVVPHYYDGIRVAARHQTKSKAGRHGASA